MFKAPRLWVEWGDFRGTIPKMRDRFLYVDPPYALGDRESRLYGQRGDMHAEFPHKELRDELRKHKKGWLLSYNDCATVRELYHDCEILPAKWAYGMNGDKQSNEVVIQPREGST